MGEEKAWNSQWWALVIGERRAREQRTAKKAKRVPVRRKQEGKR